MKVSSKKGLHLHLALYGFCSGLVDSIESGMEIISKRVFGGHGGQIFILDFGEDLNTQRFG